MAWLNEARRRFGSREGWAVLLFVGAVAVSLLRPNPEENYFWIQGQPYFDAFECDDVALNLIAGHGFTLSHDRYAPVGHWRPLYPLFLAGVYLWVGHCYAWIIALQMLLGAANAVLVFLIGERVGGRWLGFGMALLLIADRWLRSFQYVLSTETMGLFLTLWSVWFLLRGWRSERGWDWALAGVFWGLANLTRTSTLLSFPFYLLGFVWLFWRRWAALRRALVSFGLAGVLTLAPWMIRNQVVLGTPAVSINAPELVWAAAHPDYGCWSVQIIPKIFWETPAEPLGEKYQRLSREAVSMIRQHPGLFVRRGFRGLYEFLVFLPDARMRVRVFFGWLVGLTFLSVVHWVRPRSGFGRSLPLSALGPPAAVLGVLALLPLRTAWLALVEGLTLLGLILAIRHRPGPQMLLMATVAGVLVTMFLTAGATGERLRLMVDWSLNAWWLLGLAACYRWTAGRSAGELFTPPPDETSTPTPGWAWLPLVLRGMVWIVGGWAVLSAGRIALAYLAEKPSVPLPQLTAAEVQQLADQAARQGISWDRPEKVPPERASGGEPVHATVSLAELQRARAESRADCAPEYVGQLVAWTGEVVPFIASGQKPGDLPLEAKAGWKLPPGPYTIFNFKVKDEAYARGKEIFHVVWPGHLPGAWRHRLAGLVGRLEFNPEATGRGRFVVHGLALVPLDQDLRGWRLDEAVWAWWPNGPGT